MAEDYYYSSSAPKMTLVGTLGGSATTMQVDTVAGLPGAVPFKLVIDPGLTTEEIVKVTAVSGTTLTIIRGWDSSPSRDHANLAEIRHMVTAEDLRLSRQHEAKTTAHGVTGDIVGTLSTQTIANKDLSSATNVFPASLATDTEVTSAVNGHAAATTGVHGVGAGAVAGTTTTQTFTNKTMSGANNTFSNIPQSAVTSLTTDQSGQDTRLTNVEGRATSLETRATNIETKNSQQDTRLTTLETTGSTVTTNTAPLGTPQAGWSITSSYAIKSGHVVTVNFRITRTGAAVPATSSGNITNLGLGYLDAGWRPQLNGQAWSSGPYGPLSAGYIDSNGLVVLAALPPNYSVATSSELSGQATFIIP